MKVRLWRYEMTVTLRKRLRLSKADRELIAEVGAFREATKPDRATLERIMAYEIMDEPPVLMGPTMGAVALKLEHNDGNGRLDWDSR